MSNCNVTTPPEVYFLHPCSVKIDRITISGKFHAEQNYSKLHKSHWIESKQIDGRPIEFQLKRIDENGEIKGNIATLIKNQHKSDSWRIDTSNHFNSRQEKEYIRDVVTLFDSPHVTRLDIAFDFINTKHSGMKYELYRPNTTVKLKRNKAGQIETIYYGSRKSDIQYRYYDKKKEQKNGNKPIPKDIDSWERLELQLRGNKVKKWFNESLKMLSYFKRPNLSTIAETDTKKFFMLVGIINHPEYLKELNKRTQSKYRKMIKNNKGFDTVLSEQATKVLIERRGQIQNEINEFLV